MTPLLLIGYGNSIRRDDGVGPAVVARFLNHSGLRVLICQQLTPELAVDLSKCERVLFVDAEISDGDSPRMRALSPVSDPVKLGHVINPEWLLGLTEAMAGSRPLAWLVTLPVQELSYGEMLSKHAGKMADAATEMIHEWIAHSSRVFG